ncbi:Longin-like domain-containing protein [Microdochium trichocladiopsis]|uniref:Trafficking protein particle complex subunit n=1 Tax=Microdochium trichocladiopsis TaxID=1682393 RepID=A0A9P8Y9V8_9PEZI|nr:Longin-like domain-containing protein [Microdochium trichocladiopsis]KAH7031611.1 Longin-like domain-containing protein [Microdochium trichocladiopsis]
MVVLALIIINKAGGLIYNKIFAEGLNQLSTNDYLVLAGTFHGVHAITARLNPIKTRSTTSQQFPSGTGTPNPPPQGIAPPPGGGGGTSLPHNAATNPSSTTSTSTNNPAAAAALSGAGGGASGGGALADGNLLTRPEPPSGLEVMETENFRLQCFATQTGLKFLLFTDSVQSSGGPAGADAAMRRIYEYYADYVMKNPFYQLEMPVRCEMFDRRLNSYIREINSSSR